MRGPCHRCCMRRSWPPSRDAEGRLVAAGRPGRRPSVTDDGSRSAHLLVTGGAGSSAPRSSATFWRARDGTRITVLDKLTYAGNEANLGAGRDDPEQAARLRFVRGRHRRPGDGRRRSSPRPTRSSTSPPSPTSTAHPRSGGVPARPASSASTCCSRRSGRRAASGRTGPLPPGLDRRGLRLHRRGLRHARTTPLAPALAVRRGQGGRRAARARATHVTYGARRRDHPRQEHLRPVPAPREADPAVHHERDRRPAAAALRRRPPAPRLAARHRPRRGVEYVLRHGARARPTTSPGGNEMANRDMSSALLRALGKPWSLVRHGRGPARPRSALRDGRDRSSRPSAGPRSCVRRGPGATVDWYRDQRGVVAGGPSGDWDAYYERQYGARLARQRRPSPAPPDACASRSPAPAGGSGRARRARSGETPFTGPAGPIAWARARFRPRRSRRRGALLDRDRPEVVVHAAAWTDVDGCARDPELALRRNGEATGVLARACAERGVDLLVVSTNEVFDGAEPTAAATARTTADPPNPYGASKLAGEQAAQEALRGRRRGRARDRAHRLAVRRPGSRTSRRRSRRRAAGRGDGRPLRVVADEWGSPTYAADLADAIVELAGRATVAGIHHLVNAAASRADWARDVLAPAGIDVEIEESRVDLARASTPPRWGVLEPTPLPAGEPMRSGRTRWPTTRRAPAARRAARMTRSRPRPATGSTIPGVRSARSTATPTSAARSARLAPQHGAPEATFVQANLSLRPPGVLRGLHLHQRQLDHWIVADGPRVRRPRRRPARCSRPRGRAPSSRPGRSGRTTTVVIPTGVAHGFLAVEPLELLYLVTNEYDGTDELGFAWDDPPSASRGRTSRRRRTAGRSCPTGTARTRRWPSWSTASAGRSRRPLTGAPRA